MVESTRHSSDEQVRQLIPLTQYQASHNLFAPHAIGEVHDSSITVPLHTQPPLNREQNASIHTYVRQFVKEEGLMFHALIRIIQENKKGTATLAQIIQYLQPFLVKARGSNEKYRTNAVKLLAAVLVRNGHGYPRPSKEIVAMQDFFVSKMKDVFTIGPAFKGILALMTIYKNQVNLEQLIQDLLPLTNEESEDSLETRPDFEPAKVTTVKPRLHLNHRNKSHRGGRAPLETQSYVQEVRNSIFKFFCVCLMGNLERIKHFATSKFLPLLIGSIQGERDPRNLILTFRLMRCSLIKFEENADYPEQLDIWRNRIFNICTAYFPIDFTPPPNDKYNITRGDLSCLLVQVMSATEHMAELCFPFILNKIQQTSENAGSILAKKEALKYLSYFAERYPGCILEQYAVRTWDILQNELFNNYDEELRDQTIQTTAKFCRGLLQFDRSTGRLGKCERSAFQYISCIQLGDSSLESSSCKQFLRNVIDMCRSQVRQHQPTSFNVSVCIDLLLACGMACGCNVTYFVIDEFIFDLLMPRLQEVLDNHDKNNNHPDCLDIQICHIGKMYLDYSQKCMSEGECFFNSKFEKKARFLDLLRRALLLNKSVATQIDIFEIYENLLTPERIELSKQERENVICFIADFCFQSASQELISNEYFRTVLHRIALKYPQLIMECFFKKHIQGAFKRQNASRSFKIIEAVGVQLDVFLMSEISQTLVCTLEQQWECTSCSQIFCSINTLWKHLSDQAKLNYERTFQDKSLEYEQSQVKAYMSLHEDFTYNCLNHFLQSKIHPMLIFYQQAKKLVCTLIQGFLIETKRQRFQQYLMEKCDKLLKSALTFKQKRLPYLVFKGFYQNLLLLDPQKSEDTLLRSANFIQQFFSQLGYKQLPIFIENCLYKSIAIISNKSPSLFSDNIDALREVLDKNADEISFNQSPQELQLLFWVFRGRLSRGLHFDLIEQLLGKFKFLEESSRKLIAEMWPIFLKKLSVIEKNWKQFNLKYLPFTLQRIFMVTFEALNPIWNENIEALTILVTTVAAVPKGILETEQESFVGMLIKALESNFRPLQRISLGCLKKMLQNGLIPKHLHFNIFSLILPFLHISEDPQNKVNGLLCIMKLELVKNSFFHGYYENALRAFTALLNDPRRDVRRLASVCINNWECSGL